MSGISRISSGVAAAMAAILLAAGGPASAASPPPSWDNGRLLNCGDGEMVEAFFTPGGVFTSFHVVDSTDVIVPKHVEVVGLPGETGPVVTLDVPGFARNNRDTVTCTYTDPAGLGITLIGVR